MSTPASAASPAQYLSFFLAGEEYALGILQVREIIEYEAVTRVPGSPVWVRGVFNLRGRVVPLVDLAVRLGVPPGELTPWSCIVVVEVPVEGERLVMGLLADTIGQILDLAPEDVEPPPSLGVPIHADCLLGLGRNGSNPRFVLLLDIEKVFNTQEVLQAVRLPGEAPPSGTTGG
jgi:purine-binding chemotaxis protein CheW